MAMDPLEKDRLRRRMAERMGVFLEGVKNVTCISAHFYDTPHYCDLCQTAHGEDVLVIRNRSGKKWIVAFPCLKEMVRFQVTDVEDLTKWLEKLRVLRVETEKRKAEILRAQEEERKKLEKKVIVRKRPVQDNLND